MQRCGDRKCVHDEDIKESGWQGHLSGRGQMLGSMLSELGRHWGFGARESRELFQNDPSGWCVKTLQGSKSGSQGDWRASTPVTQRER